MNWWDEYANEPIEDVEVAPVEPASCKRCGWDGDTGRLIDHPRIPTLVCPRCLHSIPGTERKLNVPQCPECSSVRLTPDNKACLDCEWPELEIRSEPTTENPEDLPS